MEKIKITAEDGEIIELFVIEQTRLEGINYLLVTETLAKLFSELIEDTEII